MKCYSKLEYRRVDKVGERVWKFGEIGDTFYIILKGEVTVHVPSYTEVHLDDFEMYKLMHEFGDMLIEVNGQDVGKLTKSLYFKHAIANLWYFRQNG